MRRRRRLPAWLLAVAPWLQGCDDVTEGGPAAGLIAALIWLAAMSCDACTACWNCGAETAPYLSDGATLRCDDGLLEGFLREGDAKRRPVAHRDGRRAGAFTVNADRYATFPCEAGASYVVRLER